MARIRPLNKSLLDTDIFSDITKGVNPTVASHATAYRKAFSRYTISAVTFMEVIRGYQKKPLCPTQIEMRTQVPRLEEFPASWVSRDNSLNSNDLRCLFNLLGAPPTPLDSKILRRCAEKGLHFRR